jgi:hypothetical protein
MNEKIYVLLITALIAGTTFLSGQIYKKDAFELYKT